MEYSDEHRHIWSPLYNLFLWKYVIQIISYNLYVMSVKFEVSYLTIENSTIVATQPYIHLAIVLWWTIQFMFPDYFFIDFELLYTISAINRGLSKLYLSDFMNFSYKKCYDFMSSKHWDLMRSNTNSLCQSVYALNWALTESSEFPRSLKLK